MQFDRARLHRLQGFFQDTGSPLGGFAMKRASLGLELEAAAVAVPTGCADGSRGDLRKIR